MSKIIYLLYIAILSQTYTYQKHRENREKLPWEYLICCLGVKLFLLKYVTITAVPTATVATVTITSVTNITTVTVTTVTITTVTIN